MKIEKSMDMKLRTEFLLSVVLGLAACDNTGVLVGRDPDSASQMPDNTAGLTHIVLLGEALCDFEGKDMYWALLDDEVVWSSHDLGVATVSSCSLGFRVPLPATLDATVIHMVVAFIDTNANSLCDANTDPVFFGNTTPIAGSSEIYVMATAQRMMPNPFGIDFFVVPTTVCPLFDGQ